MSLWLKIALIALAALLIDIGVSLVPATSLALSPKLPQSFPNQPLLDALFVRPPQAAVNACVGSTGGTLTHDDFVQTGARPAGHSFSVDRTFLRADGSASSLPASKHCV
jgi:hypothetical protein